MAVTIAAWYAGPGQSFLPIAALILGLPIPLALSRLLAAHRVVLASSLFIATQLVMIYRPAVNPVPVASPLADESLVGHGGHAELVNYHYVTSTQRDGFDLLQVRDGSSHSREVRS